MKLQSNNLLENLDQQELQFLTSEVKETISKNFKKERKINLTVAQFWNIQGRRKNFRSAKFAF
ncbi:MAG: hypothetical protein ABI359_15665 [Ginsengibacter sp.]